MSYNILPQLFTIYYQNAWHTAAVYTYFIITIKTTCFLSHKLSIKIKNNGRNSHNTYFSKLKNVRILFCKRLKNIASRKMSLTRLLTSLRNSSYIIAVLARKLVSNFVGIFAKTACPPLPRSYVTYNIIVHVYIYIYILVLYFHRNAL